MVKINRLYPCEAHPLIRVNTFQPSYPIHLHPSRWCPSEVCNCNNCSLIPFTNYKRELEVKFINHDRKQSSFLPTNRKAGRKSRKPLHHSTIVNTNKFREGYEIETSNLKNLRTELLFWSDHISYYKIIKIIFEYIGCKHLLWVRNYHLQVGDNYISGVDHLITDLACFDLVSTQTARFLIGSVVHDQVNFCSSSLMHP